MPAIPDPVTKVFVALGLVLGVLVIKLILILPVVLAVVLGVLAVKSLLSLF